MQLLPAGCQHHVGGPGGDIELLGDCRCVGDVDLDRHKVLRHRVRKVGAGEDVFLQTLARGTPISGKVHQHQSALRRGHLLSGQDVLLPWNLVC